MSSVFGKMRKEAKEKNKAPRGQDGSEAEQFAVQPVVETIAPTAEELALLLSVLEVKELPSQPVVLEKKEEVITSPEIKEKTFKAYGVFYNTEKRKFMKVSIDYCPKTCYTSDAVVEDFTDSQAVAVMKISQIFSLKLVRNEDVV